MAPRSVCTCEWSRTGVSSRVSNDRVQQRFPAEVRLHVVASGARHVELGGMVVAKVDLHLDLAVGGCPGVIEEFGEFSDGQQQWFCLPVP